MPFRVDRLLLGALLSSSRYGSAYLDERAKPSLLVIVRAPSAKRNDRRLVYHSQPLASGDRAGDQGHWVVDVTEIREGSRSLSVPLLLKVFQMLDGADGKCRSRFYRSPLRTGGPERLSP